VFDTYDKQPNQTRTIKSLFYCREEVEAQYSEWLGSQAGKQRDDASTAVEPDAVRQHIEAAIAALRENSDAGLAEDIERAVGRLEELAAAPGDDAEYIDRSLYDIEAFLDRAMLSNSDKLHLKNLKKEVAAQLKLYKNAMDKEAYEKTFELMLLKRLREEHRIPRLGLFYI
jgi:hypothetical protein